MTKAQTTRIITVQGGTQLITAISLLRYFQQQEGPAHKNILVHFGSFPAIETEMFFNQSIDLIAKAWDFDECHHLNHLLKIKEPEKIRAALQQEFQNKNVVEVLCGRNWQLPNEVLLKSFPLAKKIAYGESYGSVDFSFSKKHEKIDEVYLFLPVFYSGIYFDYQKDPEKYHFINPNYIKQTFRDVFQASPSIHQHISEIEREVPEANIFLTSNFSHARVMTEEDEISESFRIIRENFSTKIPVLIKTHPRNNENKQDVLCERLKEAGYEAQVIPLDNVFAYLPFDLLCYQWNCNQIASILTSSVLALSYFCKKKVILGFNEQTASLLLSNLGDYYFELIELSNTILNKLQNWTPGSPIFQTPFIITESYSFKLNQKAVIEISRGNTQTALENFVEALEHNPYYLIVHRNIALLLLANKEFAVAASHFLKSLEFLNEPASLKSAVQNYLQNYPVPQIISNFEEEAKSIANKIQTLISSALVSSSTSPEGVPTPSMVPGLPLASAEVGPKDPVLAQHYPNVSFGNMVQIIGLSNTKIAWGSCIADDVYINVCCREPAQQTRIKIGHKVLINRGAYLSSGKYLEIGDHSYVAARAYLSSASHEYENSIYSPILSHGVTENCSLILEENCWIGVGAILSANREDLIIGRGSVVGANAVVLKNVPPFSVVVGNPAKIVKIYDSELEKWVSVEEAFEVNRLLEKRQHFPIPSNEELKKVLSQHSFHQSKHPSILAGRGVHL
jgi:acetyltransferase-like isoleucine patch superfamily enzyme